MFKANPSKSMSDHITSMHKKKTFGKKDKMSKKGKFNFSKKKKEMSEDNF